MLLWDRVSHFLWQLLLKVVEGHSFCTLIKCSKFSKVTSKHLSRSVFLIKFQAARMHLSCRGVDMMTTNIYNGVYLPAICCGSDYTSIQVLGLRYNLLWTTWILNGGKHYWLQSIFRNSHINVRWNLRLKVANYFCEEAPS